MFCTTLTGLLFSVSPNLTIYVGRAGSPAKKSAAEVPSHAINFGSAAFTSWSKPNSFLFQSYFSSHAILNSTIILLDPVLFSELLILLHHHKSTSLPAAPRWYLPNTVKKFVKTAVSSHMKQTVGTK